MSKSKYWEPEIVHIWFKEGTTIDVLYDDGIIRRLDIMSLSNEYPNFDELKNRKLFLLGKNYIDGIRWNEKIDISSWAMYDYGTDVTQEYRDYEQYLVGHKLKNARIKKHISQEELSLLTGIDQATICKIEKGSMNVSVKTIMKIVKALKAKVELIIK